MAMNDFHVVIVGGGTAGITVAARLRRHSRPPRVTIIEPSESHYYQPLWTLVGGGVFKKEESARREFELIPKGAAWLKDSAEEFLPEQNSVRTKGGRTVHYDYLVVCPGLQIDWDKIKGLAENVGKNGVCSNYSYETVSSTWDNIRNFKGGAAIFTQPSSGIKCGGAPQKICYLAEEAFRRAGVRQESKVSFVSGTPSIFAVEKYAKTLNEVIRRKNIETHFLQDLVELRARQKEAIFRHVKTGDETVMSYDMIHVTPQMSAPEFIKRSPLADGAGWVDVDKLSLQHKRYPNVFGIGDASNLPTSKTGAAVRKQAPALVANLFAHHEGKATVSAYDGYTSCPLVTGYHSLVLAEFDYDKKPAETFPFDQSKERYSMYLLKAHGLPWLYWHAMMRGFA
jgi:sulfide:quinone oxidoreductase